MIKKAICDHCNIDFSYDPNSGSTGKFCTHPCYLAYRTKNSLYKSTMVHGYRQMIYPIICIHCGSPKDAVRKNAKYCSARCCLLYEYSHNLRDKKATTKAAHESVRLNGQPKLRGIKRGRRPQEVYDRISATKFRKHKEYREAHGLPEPKLTQELRGSRKWREWRLAVYERDNYACVLCGDNKGGNLEADHMKPRYLFPELTFDIDNGRTLCKPCHKKTPTYGSKVLLMTRADFDVAA